MDKLSTSLRLILRGLYIWSYNMQLGTIYFALISKLNIVSTALDWTVTFQMLD
jgi:hypothetical protein